MRRFVVAMLVLGVAPARVRAETVPIAVAPFANRCFDAATLAERVRAAVGELPVTVGPAPRGSHQAVRVSGRAGSLRVEVVARDAHGAQVGRAERVLPADVDCATALEVAALIVARAAMPLNWPRPNEPRERAGERRHAEHAERAEERAPAAEPPAAPAAPAHPAAPAAATRPAAPAPPAPARPAAPAPARPAAPAPAHAAAAAPAPADRRPEPARPADTIVLRTRGPDRSFVGELWAAALGAFALGGGGGNLPGGELAVGFRHRRFGAAARATVDGDWSTSVASSAGDIAVDTRRYTVALEAHADVRLRVGALRFAAGPTLPLYSARTSGIPHSRSTLVVSAAVSARILYHLDLGRIFITGGLACDVNLLRDQLVITGAGVVARAPLVWLGPLLALGVNL